MNTPAAAKVPVALVPVNGSSSPVSAMVPSGTVASLATPDVVVVGCAGTVVVVGCAGTVVVVGCAGTVVVVGGAVVVLPRPPLLMTSSHGPW
jgi:hypothetical protein